LNVNELKAEIVRNGMTIEEFADRTGIKRTTVWRRFENTDGFKLKEIKIIAKVLKLNSERVVDIFFTDRVS